MMSKLWFFTWTILLPIMVVDAANKISSDFTIAVFGTVGNDPASKIANHFKQAVFDATRIQVTTVSSQVLESPDNRFDFSQAALAQSNMTDILPQGITDFFKVTYESDTSIDPLPIPAVVQSLGKMLSKAFQDVIGVAFIFEGHQNDPVYYFPSLKGKRRPIIERSKKVFDYWTPERIASAAPREMEIQAGKRILRAGRTLQQTVGDSPWLQGGVVQTAVGRLLFTMSARNFMCTGTAVTDTASDRTVIITAAHCAYNDQDKVSRCN